MKSLTIAAILLLLPAIGLAQATSVREVVTAQGLTANSDRATADKQAKLTPEAAVMKRGAGDRSQRKAPAADAANVNQDFWIFDATTVIRDDFDGDGFYTRVELDFDADTVFEFADVYAVLYLSLEGGDWIEYGVTDVFRIYGASGNDTYFFDSDLVAGFPTGYYDVLIDLYDTFDDRLVASFGPSDSAELFDLPLESQSLDSEEIIVVVTEEGGGSTGLVLLALLALTLAGRRLPARLARRSA